MLIGTPDFLLVLCERSRAFFVVLEVIYQRRIMYIMYSLVGWCGESLCVLYLEFVFYI